MQFNNSMNNKKESCYEYLFISANKTEKIHSNIIFFCMSCIDVLRHEKRDLPSSKKCTMYKDTNNSNKGWTLLLHCKIEFLCYMILLTLCRSIQFLFNFILVFKLFALVSPYEGVLSAFGPSAWQVPDLYSIIFFSINLICLWINQKSKLSDFTREKLRGEMLKMMRFYCTDDVIIEGT